MRGGSVMDILKIHEVELLQNYGKNLHSFVEHIREEKPDYIIAMPRKAPRLIELCCCWGMDVGDSPVITDKAMWFLNGISLEQKKKLVVDDIIIVGSTISWFLKENPVLQDSKVLCFIRHDKWFTEELFLEPNLPRKVPVSWIITLTQHDAAVFCSELVRSIAYLNKPYDIDYPILYSFLSSIDLEKLYEREFPNTAYEVSTSFHRLIDKRKISFIPDPTIRERFVKNVFRNNSRISPQIVKCRLYYDEVTNSANFVPMFIFHASLSDLDVEKPFSEEHFSEYNKLIVDLIKPLPESFKIKAYHSLLTYIASYLYGIAFCVCNDQNSICLSQPSDFLSLKDLTYIFGPYFAQQLLYRLNLLYPETVETFHSLFDHITNTPKYYSPEVKFLTSSINPFAYDQMARELYENIKSYLNENIPTRETLVDKVACIFEALFLRKEIPARNRIKAKRSLEGEERRLAQGFNYEQIRQILIDYRAIDPNDTSINTRLSLVVDILVDIGIIIPFYKEKNSKFERIYRYGEDGLQQQKMGFLLDGVLKQLNSYIYEFKQKSYIPKITLEKILVLLKQKLEQSPEHIQFLQTADTKAGMRTFDLKLDYCLHGAIVVESHQEGERPQTDWLTGWCLKRGILEEYDNGYRYSDKFLKNLLAEGEVNPEDNSMVPKKISSEYLMLAGSALYVDSIIDPSNGNKYLICLSSCYDIKSTLDAMRKELEFLFEDKGFPFGDGYSINRVLKVLYRDLIGYLSEGKGDVTGLWEKCDRELKNADIAANSLKEKHDLFMDRSNIIKCIEEHFENLPLSNHHYGVYYQSQLKPFVIDKIKREAEIPLSTEVESAREKLLQFGLLCVDVCLILKTCSSITNSLITGPKTKKGELYKQTQAKILREIEELQQQIVALNEKVRTCDISFFGIRLPEIDQITLKSVPQIVEWTRTYDKLVKEITNLWNSMTQIYEQNYSITTWNQQKEILFPKDSRETPLLWAIWYDIKDSQGKRNPENKEKIPHLKDAINRAFDNTRKNLGDGKFTGEVPEKNDEKFIHTCKKESIPIFLKILLNTLDDYDMFVRVGIASVHDTGEKILRISGSDFLESERNFALPKRLGKCLQKENVKALREYNNMPEIPEESYDAHTVVLSNEAWRQIWDRQSPFEGLELIHVDFVVEREHKIHIFHAIPKRANLKILTK